LSFFLIKDMLKKYSEYINNVNESSKKNDSEPVIAEPRVIEPEVNDPIVIEPIVSEPSTNTKLKINKNTSETKNKINENIYFNGKIVLFNGPIKPSNTISLLESKKIDKSKLHFILTEQEDSLVLLKYNLNTKINIKIFTETLIKYYNEKNIITETINVKGSESFVIINNLSENNKKILISNIQKLLK